MDFTIIGDIPEIETFAVGRKIRELGPIYWLILNDQSSNRLTARDRLGQDDELFDGVKPSEQLTGRRW